MKALDTAEDKIISREGFVGKVYADSLSVPTGGYGHKILSSDNLRMGDVVSQDLAETWLKKDLECAYNLAVAQANELGKMSEDFIAALTCANYQLGNFQEKFPVSFNLLKIGDWENAVDHLKKSLWMKQTPVRVNDFILSIKRASVPWWKRRLGLT